MGRWLCQGQLTHLSQPDLALLPLANDAKLSEEAINFGGTHRNGMQRIVKAHGQARGVLENLKETISRKPVLGCRSLGVLLSDDNKQRGALRKSLKFV